MPFNGYKPIHLLRPTDGSIDFKTKGGGVSIFVKDHIHFKHRNDLVIMESYIECSFIELKFNNQKYLIGGIYRAPEKDIDHFNEAVNKLIEPLRSSHQLILLGDSNVDLLKDDNVKSSFENTLQSNYLVPTILSPTRVVMKKCNGQDRISSTLIDNIFINHNTNHQSGIIETAFSDHYSVFIIIPEISTSQQGSSTIQYRLINHNNINKFNHLLLHNGIKDVLNITDAETAYNQFSNIFDTSYNASFPIKTKMLSQKDIQKPWINDTLIGMIKNLTATRNLLSRAK